jgi:hypothetical protein
MNPLQTRNDPIAVPCDNGALLLIRPPEGWLMSPPQAPARLLLIDAAAPGPFRANINVVVQNLGQMTPEEWLTLTRLQLKSMGEKVTIERDEALGKRPGGHIFDYTAQFGPVSVRCLQLILLQGSAAHVITALAPADQFEAYRSRLESSLFSVTLTLSA